EVEEAYDVLSDSKKRQMYDQYGFYSDNFQGGAPPPGGDAGSSRVNFDFGGFDFDPGAGGAGGSTGGTSFRDLFSQFFRGGRSAGKEKEEKPGGGQKKKKAIDFCGARRAGGGKVIINARARRPSGG